MQIHPQYLLLDTVLKNRLFRIPEYQRAYSWGSKQREDLFDDITKLKGKEDTVHFMATMVGLRRERRTILTTQHQVIEVVDGQQRLTTLIILLKAIAIALSGTNKAEVAVRQEIESLLVKDDENSLILLQTNHDASEYFANYLRNGEHPQAAVAKTLADRALLSAMAECETFVGAWTKSNGSLLELVTIVKNRLAFILHEINDESVVYTVFEVLNSRGLDVSWFDRLKSILMGIAFESNTGNEQETIKELHEIWSRIYRCIGLRQGLSTEALRFAATLKAPHEQRRPLGEEDAVDGLRKIAGDSVRGVVEVSKWIHRVTEAVDVLHRDNRRNAVTKIAQARLLAVAIHLRKEFTEAEKEQLIDAWERVSFRIYGMCGKDARTAVGDYVKLAWKICSDGDFSSTEALRRIQNIGSQFSIEEALESMQDKNCYDGWQSELRYFFYRYEEYLARKKKQKFSSEQWNRIWEDSAANSIEHIMPQSRGADEPSGRKIFVHRLGNLVLLPPGANSKLGDKPPKEKVDTYLRSGLLVATEVVEDLAEWNRDAVAARETKLLEFARQQWG